MNHRHGTRGLELRRRADAATRSGSATCDGSASIPRSATPRASTACARRTTCCCALRATTAGGPRSSYGLPIRGRTRRRGHGDRGVALRGRGRSAGTAQLIATLRSVIALIEAGEVDAADRGRSSVERGRRPDAARRRGQSGSGRWSASYRRGAGAAAAGGADPRPRRWPTARSAMRGPRSGPTASASPRRRPTPTTCCSPARRPSPPRSRARCGCRFSSRGPPNQPRAGRSQRPRRSAARSSSELS